MHTGNDLRVGLISDTHGLLRPEALVTPVARELRDAIWRAGIDVREILRVQDGRYWSYMCANQACCPPAGTFLARLVVAPSLTP